VRSQSPPGQASDYPSPITPAGVVQGYGNIFRAMRGQSRSRRLGAISFTLLFLFPIFVIIIGYTVMLLRAL
jgi:hypothetical protein